MFGKGRKTDLPQEGAKSSEKEGKGSWFKENQRSIIAVGLIVIMAFVMRFVFAYGVSADSAFALSGGTVASEHLHTITQILDGGSFFGVDDTLSYPFGSVNSNPVLIDTILAGIAMIGTSLGMSAVKAASLTLATFSLVCGTFAVIPMFLLGKEVVGTRKAGFVAALFLAFCPIVITKTVFSNGTETGWILLLFIVLSLMMFKGLKAVNSSSRTEDPFGEVIAVNRSAMKLAAISGLVLALIVLSTNAFRPVVVMMIIAMAIMTVVGRFMYRDTRPVVLFFSIIILIGMAVAAAYYIPAMLWDQVLSGILIASAASIVICLTFSLLQRKPWVVTVPAYLIGVIAVLVLLYFFAPEFYQNIVNGNTIYAACIAPLAGGTPSLSYLSTAFGVVAMWLGIFVIGVLIWKIPKNISSFRYQFLVIFMFFCAYMTFQSEQMATIFSPVFALGFAYAVMWLFDHVDFKTYFMMIKNAGWKNAWKKVLKPIPFATIIAIALLLCVPLGMYAIDASISNNSTDDYEGLDLGAIGYTVDADSYWLTPDGSENGYLYSTTEKDGALVTWTDYANNAATMGKFKVITDAEGNGAEAVSNILLSNAVDGSSNAAMLIYLLTKTGMTDEIKTALGMTDEKFSELKKIIEEPSKFRDIVTHNTEKYGILESDVSDENIRYIYGSEFLTENYSAYKIASMYSAVEAKAGNVSYIMVDGSMFPIYYGYSSLFATMSYANGYLISDSYGTVPQFLTVSTYAYYYGLYEYTDAMYDTLLWRAYIGMSPAEAGLDSFSYIQALALSDGTYKAEPGYGLSNFTVDYDHWYVMYNPDKDAKVSSDGWEKMLYADAVAKQKDEGGLINYLSGLPVFMKYVPNDPENAVSGHVSSTASANVQGIRVSVVDSEGKVRSTAFTDKYGNYEILVTGDDPTIRFYSGSQNLTDGSLIDSVRYSTVVDHQCYVTIAPTNITNAVFINSDDKEVDMTGAVLKLEGKVSKNTYTPAVTDAGFNVADLVPDEYTVTLVSALDDSISYVTDRTITVSPGYNYGVKVLLNSKTVTLSIVDDAKAPLEIAAPNHILIKNVTTGAVIYDDLVTDADGKKEINLIAGTYVCSFEQDYVVSSAPFAITKESTSVSITAHSTSATPINLTGFPVNKMVYIYSSGFSTAAMTNGSGNIENVNTLLPVGTGAGAVYTAYASDGTKGYIATTAAPDAVQATMKVTGTMKNKSGDATSGTIIFASGARQIPVSVNSDGTYSVFLTGDEYTVYAHSGSDVSISKITPTDGMVKDIELGEGINVTASAVWGTNGMPFVPIVVSDISGCEGCGFTLTTDNAGSFSFYLPKESTCNVTSNLKDSGKYNYGGLFTKTVTTGSNGSLGNFEASVGNISVTNNTGHKIKINSTTEIENASSGSAKVSSGSWSIEISDDGVYSVRSIRVNPDKDIELPATFFDDSKIYYMCTVTGLQSGETVTVKGLGTEPGDYIKNDTNKFYLQYVDGDPKDFMFTITNADSTKVMYMIIHALGAPSTFAADTRDAATVKGYVGYNGDGTMKLAYDDSPAVNYEFTITSGRYTVLVPIDRAFTLSPVLKDESASVTYTYEAPTPIHIGAGVLAAGSTNVYNTVVTSSVGPGTDEITADMVITDTVDGETSDVYFTVVFTRPAAQPAKTYSLIGGSKWSDVKFYTDAGRTAEVTTVSFGNLDETATIYGKGSVVKNSVACADDDLSVILKDSNAVVITNGKEVRGKVVCTAMITTIRNEIEWADSETEWVDIRTTSTEQTTKVNIGSNSVGDSEYMYAIEIINGDNFTKKYSIVPAGIDTDKWFVTYVNGKDIVADGVVKVKGFTTATVYVKITYKSGDEAPDRPESIESAITVTDLSGVAINVYTDSSDVTVAGNVATATSTTSNSTISVDETGATGRDVVDAKSDMPVYVWVLIALAVALLFLIIWAASKRGVFTRRK